MASNIQLFLGDKPIGESYLGDKFTEYNISSSIPPAPVTIPQAGLQFWLDPTSYSGSGSKWLSTYGNATGSFTGSYIYSGSTFFNMNTSSVCQFNTTSSLDYGGLSQPNTLFVVGRSSGSATDQHGRLLGGQNNWLMGTYGGGGGAGATEYQRSYYDGTFVINDTPYDTLWRVYTAVWQNGSSGSFFVNGQWVAESTAAQSAFSNFSINNGAFQTGTAGGYGENTQADYGDIILYDRVLTKVEIAQVYDVIKSKYGLT